MYSSWRPGTASSQWLLLPRVLHHPGVGAFALLLVANAAATPALAAAQYLNLYVHAVQLREQAGADRRRIQTRLAAEEAIEEDAAGRLQALRAEVVPLLSGVADGTLAVDDPQVALLAHRLGDDLRRELTAARNGQWLLPVSRPRKETPRGRARRRELISSIRTVFSAAFRTLTERRSQHCWTCFTASPTGSASPSPWPRGQPSGRTRRQPDRGLRARRHSGGYRLGCWRRLPRRGGGGSRRQFGANLHLETSDVLVAETSLTLSPPVRFLGVTTYGCP